MGRRNGVRENGVGIREGRQREGRGKREGREGVREEMRKTSDAQHDMNDLALINISSKRPQTP